MRDDACRCGGTADPQTNRCLGCGRLKVADSTPAKPIAASTRPSPSRAYRFVDTRIAAEPPAPVAAPTVEEFSRALGVEPATENGAIHEAIEDAVESGDGAFSVFGTPTIKRYCGCGGITVAIVGTVLPPRCAFCGREQTWVEADMVATFGARS